MSELVRRRVLIWAKTYPEMSTRHVETVCTAGCGDDGRPIRLYPVPLRYLEDKNAYALYSVVELNASRTTQDNRPESHKVDPTSIRILDHIKSDTSEWAERRAWIFRDTSWHFESLGALEAARLKDATSLGMIRPGSIEDVVLKAKPASARRTHDEKWATVTAQKDVFLPEYKNLAFLPYEIRLVWRCAAECELCRAKPHDSLVMDWGLLELARKEGDWEKARQRLVTLADHATYDFRLFIGNYKRHQQNWGVIGMWYPKLAAQRVLL